MQEPCYLGQLALDMETVSDGKTEETKGKARPEGIAVVTAPIEGDLLRLEAFLAGQVAEFEPEVQPLVEYTLRHSGKKIRPILVFYAGWTEDGLVSDDLIRAGAVVELVHLATLVHDDILDDAEMRHRMPTVAARHGADVAVLLGDALFAHALKLAADFPTVDICRAVAGATRQVCSGEIAQTFARGEVQLPLPSYFRMIDLKTAELFAVSAWLGAFLARSGGGFAAAAADYARELGIAYQIYDDVADFLAQEDRAGKTLGTDLASGKFTLPVLLFMESLKPEAVSDWTRRLAAGEVRLRELRDAMTEAGVFRRVHELFAARMQAADALLQPFADIPATGRLRLLGAYIGKAMDRFAPGLAR